MIRKAVGQAVFEIRKRQRLTQQELGERLDRNRRTVARWECGDHMPDEEAYSRLPGALGVSPEIFLDAVDRAQRRLAEESPPAPRRPAPPEDQAYALPLTPPNAITGGGEDWIMGYVLIPRKNLFR